MLQATLVLTPFQLKLSYLSINTQDVDFKQGIRQSWLIPLIFDG